MKNELVFRKASYKDLDAIERIYERSHDAEAAGLTTTGWLRDVYPVRAVAEAALERDDMYVCEIAAYGIAQSESGEFEIAADGITRGVFADFGGVDASGKVIVATGVINRIQVDVYALCDWVYKGPDEDVSVLHTLAVDPAARGMGIGPAFVRFWEQLAAEEGCSILRIDTNARNKKARRMYEKLGYIESGIVPTVFNGIPGVDLVLMEKFNGTAIQKRLREMQDEKYADFQMALIPGKERERAIGVRTPQLRAFAKELLKEAEAKGGGKISNNEGGKFSGSSEGVKGVPEKSVGANGAFGSCEDAEYDLGYGSDRSELERFLGTLPHKYFDEMQLHAFLISETKDISKCFEEVETFLPYIDNWATCDQLSPKVFGKKKNGRLIYGSELLEHIDRWLESDETYTVRFGIGMLLQHFLDADFDPAYMGRVAEIRSDEYYIKMMIAWYFATALAKQYDAALPVLLENRLDVWTHNKTIQKAVESRRITDDQKAYLKTLRRKA